MLSLKKEIVSEYSCAPSCIANVMKQQDTVDSLVPLLYHKVSNLKLSVSLIVEAVEKAIQNFDRTAEKLRKKYSGDEKIAQRLNAHIEASQMNCTGNLHWSLRTGRYGVSQRSIVGGVTIHLE